MFADAPSLLAFFYATLAVALDAIVFADCCPRAELALTTLVLMLANPAASTFFTPAPLALMLAEGLASTLFAVRSSSSVLTKGRAATISAARLGSVVLAKPSFCRVGDRWTSQAAFADVISHRH